MTQEQNKKNNILIVVAVVITVILGGVLWFVFSGGFNHQEEQLPILDISVNGKVSGYTDKEIKLLVPKLSRGDSGVFVDNKERNIGTANISSIVTLDAKTKSKSTATVSDIRFGSELIVYGKTTDLENGLIMADKIEILK